jgi:hypothetical protein
MKPRIVMTSTTPWEFEYLKRIIDSVGLKNATVSTGRTWLGKYKIIVQWDEQSEKV